ncbi:hypothetical protein T4C_8386, partial [Trichinella pseudospiralis]
MFHRATPLEPGEDQCTVISSPQQTDVDLVRSRRRIRCLLHLFPDLRFTQLRNKHRVISGGR